MINVDKVRLWNVRFSRDVPLEYMPYPYMIVEEVETKGYHMPLFSPQIIPADVGGQITITLEGRGILKVGKQKFECVPGTAFLYRDNDPEVSYYFPADSRNKWRFVWINFMGESSNNIISEINRIYGYHFSIGKNSELEKKLLSYHKFAGSTFLQNSLDAAQMFFELLGMLCQPNDKKLNWTPQNHQIADVQNEIQTAFAESLTISALAKKLGISREHLSKKFHMQTGRTLQDYREEQRLNEALTLLLKSNISCKEIATLCHYGSYSSFFRSFKKHYNISPEEFRKKNL